MEPYEFNREKIRNRLVVFLILIALIGVACFSAFAHERYTRQARLENYKSTLPYRAFSYSGPIQMGAYTLVFEQGRLSAWKGDELISRLYTDFDNPLFSCVHGFCAIYSYPSPLLYLFSQTDGEILSLALSAPISAVRIAENGTVATLNDMDSVISVYTPRGVLQMQVRSDGPIFDLALSGDGDMILFVTSVGDDPLRFRCESYSVKRGKMQYRATVSATSPVFCYAERGRLFVWSEEEQYLIGRYGKIHHLPKTP